MRRLASFFASNRASDHSPDNTSAPSARRSASTPSATSLTVFNNRALNSSHSQEQHLCLTSSSLSVTPPLRYDNASSNSSSGSASLPTPDEDIPFKPSATRSSSTKSKKNLFSWLPSKKPEPVRPPVPPVWESSHPAPTLQLPPPGNRGPHDSETSESDVDYYDDDYDEHQAASASAAHTYSIARSSVPASPEQLRHYLRVSTESNLAAKQMSSPCYTRHASPAFPRSSHISRRLTYLETLQSRIHRRHILRKLEKCTDEELRLIATIDIHTVHTVVSDLNSTPDVNEPHPDLRHISSSSLALDRWLSRPCFEDRCVDWKYLDGQILFTRIVGSELGVAGLEFSDRIEVLAGYDALDGSPVSHSIPTPVGNSSKLKPEPPIVSVSPPLLTSRSGSFVAVHPSPLRNEHDYSTTSNMVPSLSLDKVVSSDKTPSPLGSTPQLSSSPTTIAASPTDPTTSANNGKRGVRFAEESDKDEQVPLGYFLRQKERKAQKAKFLREERERREFEAEMAKVEQERKKRDEEKQKWEQERREWEAEKKKVEEERKARLYAEELANARYRRATQQRAGPSRSASENSVGLLTSSSSGSLHERTRNVSPSYSRPAYDSIPQISTRRMTSEPILPTNSPSPSSSNSRPSSIAHSRPPSVHSSPMSSVEDFRPPNKNRHSLASSGRSQSYMGASSTWSASTHPQNVMMVPVMPPVFPYFVAMDSSMAMNMPLIPPTPPFFSESRSRSRDSSSSSRRSGQGSSTNSQQQQQQPPGPQHQRNPVMYNSVSRSSSYLPQVQSTSRSPQPPSGHQRSSHQRRYSGDASSGTGGGHSTPAGGPKNVTRGRTQHPATSSQQQQQQQQQQVPSPWTALPSSRGSYTSPGSKRQPVYV